VAAKAARLYRGLEPGHVAFYEQPEEFTKLVEGFVSAG
jgi:hypothetical protein